MCTDGNFFLTGMCLGLKSRAPPLASPSVQPRAGDSGNLARFVSPARPQELSTAFPKLGEDAEACRFGTFLEIVAQPNRARAT